MNIIEIKDGYIVAEHIAYISKPVPSINGWDVLITMDDGVTFVNSFDTKAKANKIVACFLDLMAEKSEKINLLGEE